MFLNKPIYTSRVIFKLSILLLPALVLGGTALHFLMLDDMDVVRRMIRFLFYGGCMVIYYIWYFHRNFAPPPS